MKLAVCSRPGRYGARGLKRATEYPVVPAMASVLLAAMVSWGTLTLDGFVRMPWFISIAGQNARATLAALLGPSSP